MVGAPFMGPIFDGEERHMVPVRFERLTDPSVQYLINEANVRSVLSDDQIKAQSSGNTVSNEQSQRLEMFLDRPYLIDTGIDPNLADEEAFNPENITDARERVVREVARRRGQRHFRDLLMESYSQRCVVTACPIVDILEAAHIFPYLGAATNHVSNGLLLRSDIHMLFDCGLLGFSHEDFAVVLAPRLLGTTYEKLKGRKLRKPISEIANPNRKALEKHLCKNNLIAAAG